MKKHHIPETVLIVNDGVENLHLLTKLLTDNGYRIRASKTGREALTFIMADLPDLVLLDVKLPDINGFDVCKRLKEKDATKAIPVIFISGLTDTADKLKGFAVGAVDYITKPFINDEVIVRVKNHLEMSRLRSDLEYTANELLQKNREDFKELFDEAPVGYHEINAEGRIVRINRTELEILGYSMAEMIGEYFWKFAADETLSKQAITAKLTRKSRMKSAYERDFRKKDGSVVSFLVTDKILESAEGKIIGIRSNIQDITERKQLEKELRESEEQLKFAMNGANDGIWDVNMETNSVYISPRGCEILGYEPDRLHEIVAQWSQLVHPDDMAQTNAALTAYLEGKTPMFNIEQRLRMASGDWKWIHTRGKTVAYNSENKPLRMVGTHTDITDRKQTEEALKLSEEKFKKAFMTSPDSININRIEDGTYLLLNQGFINMFGFLENEVIGKTSIELNIWYDVSDRKKWVKELNEKGEIRNFETRFRTKNGRVIYALVSGAIIELGGVKHVLSITRDITERKEAENKLLESEEKFRNFFEYSVVGKSITEFNGRLKVNKAFSDIVGYSEDELNQLHWKEITHPDDIDFKQREIESLLNGEKRYSSFQSRFIHKNGSIVWADFNTVLLRDKQGKPNHFITSVNDITDKKLANEKIERNEKRFRALVENVQDMVSIFNADNQIVYTSPAVERITGYTLKELQQMTGPDFVHPDEMEARARLKQNCLNNPGVSIHIESRLVHKNGHTIWVEGTVTNLLHDESVAGIVTNFRDITERKQAERILQESEDRHRSLFQRNSSVMLILNPDNGDIIDANPAACNYYGWTYDEISRKNISEINMFEKTEILEILSQTKKEQQNHLFLRHRLSNGEIREVEVYATPIKHGDSVLLYSIIHDVTERKRAEEALRLSEEKLSALFSSMTEMVVINELVFDDAGNPINYRIADCNNAFTSTMGWQKENVIGRLATEVYQTAEAPYLEAFSKVAITGQSSEFDTYYVPLSKHFRISAVSPRTNTFALIVADITQIKQIQEEIMLKNKELESYLYIASHDLRSPLVNIQGFSQRLLKQSNELSSIISDFNLEDQVQTKVDTIINEGVPKSLHFILSNVLKMDSLINSLLQISRTGRLTLSIGKVNMNQLFKTIVATQDHQLTECSAQVLIHEIHDCYGDENQLNQIFSNIIDNAIKYRSKDRNLSIDIESKEVYHKIIYSIKDNGKGISKRNMEKIWDVFFRADTEEKGEGIGLSIAKTITSKHKGRMWVESEEGVGSTFFVELQQNEFTEQ